MKQIWVYMFLVSALSLAFLTGCGRVYWANVGAQGPPGADGAPGTSAPVVTPSSVQTMVANENTYRASVGQEPLTLGMTCSLYTVPTTTTQIIGATGLVGIGSWQYLDQFNVQNSPVTNGFPVLPVALQPVYQTWFIVKCTGQLVITDDFWHNFSLTSDDGANLYIDGLLINNDGLHGVQTVNAVKFLKYGFHSFEVDYLQAAGQQALILNEDGNLMGTGQIYH